MSISPIEVYLNSKYYTLNLCSNKNDLSDLIFYMSQPITRPDGYFMKLKVTSLTLPISNYLIDSTNNTLIINSTTYTVTQGNYNTTSLMSYLNSVLSGIVVSFSSTTNKFTFTSATSFTISASSTILSVLGFSGSKSGTSVTSDLVCDLSGSSNIIYIDISNVNTFNISSYTGRRTSIVKSVVVNVNQGAVLFYENMNDTHCYLQENMINYLHIKLLGEDMITPLQLNGVNWNITLQFSFVEIPPQLPDNGLKKYLLDLNSNLN